HAIVIGLAGKGYAILCAGKFFHQLLGGFVGFQLGVVLGHCVEVCQGFGEQVLCTAKALNLGIVARVFGGVFLGADCVIPGFHYLSQRRFLVVQIGLGCFNQVRDQIVPALQLHINLGKAIFELIAQR